MESVSKGAFTRTEVKRIVAHNSHRLDDVFNDAKTLSDFDRKLFTKIIEIERRKNYETIFYQKHSNWKI